MKDLQEFERYMAHLGERLGHADRQGGLRAPLKRKSVEPMAAHLAPSATRSRHQSLHHFVADSAWSDEQMLLRVAQWVVPAMDFSDGGWWIVDDTGFPKQGRHSVGVARQYCGMLGKQDNCQVAVSVSLACEQGSLPVAWQMYCVLADAGYGVDTAFRERLGQMGLAYAVGVTGQVTVWPPGHAPLPPKPYSGRGHVPTRLRRGDVRHEQPLSVKEVAFGLAADQWQNIEWREGTNFTLRSRFARVRVRAAHREHLRTEQRPEEWLLIEWPEGHKEPMKYWLSTLDEDVLLERMVYEAKMRWRIERDYQDLKQELGLGHYEGRGWRGFHHHASLSIAAYGFLTAQQLRHPEGAGKKNAARSQEPALPTHYKPRGSPAHAAPRPIVHHDFAAAYRRSLAQDAAQVSVLPAGKRKTTLVTQ